MHSIWLMPSADACARFSDYISQLSKHWSGPVFPPHITLLGDLNRSADSLIAECAVTFSALPAGRATVTGAAGGEAFFTSLYLDVSLPDSHTTGRARLAGSFNSEPSKAFRPHISLAYGPVGGTNKSGLIEQIAEELTGYEFELASIEIFESAKTIPVESWHSIWRHDLAPLGAR